VGIFSEGPCEEVEMIEELAFISELSPCDFVWEAEAGACASLAKRRGIFMSRIMSTKARQFRAKKSLK